MASVDWVEVDNGWDEAFRNISELNALLREGIGLGVSNPNREAATAVHEIRHGFLAEGVMSADTQELLNLVIEGGDVSDIVAAWGQQGPVKMARLRVLALGLFETFEMYDSIHLIGFGE